MEVFVRETARVRAMDRSATFFASVRTRVVAATMLVASRVLAGETPVEVPFRFHAPEGFVDARTRHGRALEPAWPVFCAEEGVVSCAFSAEFEDDGVRAFAYAKLVPGSQPVTETLMAKLARSLESAIDTRDAVVHVDERALDTVRGHAVGRILATVTASGHITRRWLWVMATPDALAMITFVAPGTSFDRLRPAFDASARATEGVIDGIPLLLRALTQGQGRKGILVVLYILLGALLIRVVMQANAKRPR